RVQAKGLARDGIIPLGERILIDKKFPVDEHGRFNFTTKLKKSDRIYVAAFSCLIQEYTLENLLTITFK
ncbi:hypothetical protein L0244_28260, partial [bacterium]|nr:hypothetical protein [bacterium]